MIHFNILIQSKLAYLVLKGTQIKLIDLQTSNPRTHYQFICRCSVGGHRRPKSIPQNQGSAESMAQTASPIGPKWPEILKFCLVVNFCLTDFRFSENSDGVCEIHTGRFLLNDKGYGSLDCYQKTWRLGE